jgi:serine/threonine-protein kinase RsbT
MAATLGPGTMRIPITKDQDAARAVLEGTRRAAELGLDQVTRQKVSTAISELARNIIKYAGGQGTVTIRTLTEAGRTGLEVVAADRGPGIENVEEALEDHFSSSGTLGLGLPGVRRLMDEFEIRSEPGVGTTVTVRIWV